MTETQMPPTIRSRTHRVALRLGVVVGALTVAAFIWTAPREDIDVPGPDADPEEVVTAYIEAVNARDFETANAIDARSGSDLGRFSRPLQAHEVHGMNTALEGPAAHVVFKADFNHGDGTVADGWWGYFLERDDDGMWHITDEGVG